MTTEIELKTAGELIRDAAYTILTDNINDVQQLDKTPTVCYVLPSTMSTSNYPIIEVSAPYKSEVRSWSPELNLEKWELTVAVYDTTSKASSTKRDDGDVAVLKIRDEAVGILTGDQTHLGLSFLHLYNQQSKVTLHDPEMIRETTRVCGFTMEMNVLAPKSGYIEISTNVSQTPQQEEEVEIE